MSAPDPLHDLGVRAGAEGGEIRVWSEHATSVDLVIFDADDLDWASERTPLTRDGHGVWSGASAALGPGAHYGLRVDGPAGFDHAFNPVHTLLDPYARGLSRADDGSWWTTDDSGAYSIVKWDSCPFEAPDYGHPGDPERDHPGPVRVVALLAVDEQTPERMLDASRWLRSPGWGAP